MAKRSIEPLPVAAVQRGRGGVGDVPAGAAAAVRPGVPAWAGSHRRSYDDIAGLLGNPLTRLVLFGVFTLSLFHWAHRFRFTLYDGLQLKHLGRQIALLCYGGAALGSLVAAYLLLRLVDGSQLGELGERRNDAHLLAAEVDDHRVLSFDRHDVPEAVAVVGDSVAIDPRLDGRRVRGDVEGTACKVPPSPGGGRSHQGQCAPFIRLAPPPVGSAADFAGLDRVPER